MQENPQKLFDLLTELWNTGNTKLVNELYTKSAVRGDPNLPQEVHGAEAISEYIEAVRKGFPDFSLTINQSFRDDDRAAMEWTCSGTHEGEFLGVPATHRRITITGMTLDLLKDGKIAEERTYFNRLELLQQLGVVPAPEVEAKSAAQP